jgi:hypothetical protein
LVSTCDKYSMIKQNSENKRNWVVNKWGLYAPFATFLWHDSKVKSFTKINFKIKLKHNYRLITENTDKASSYFILTKIFKEFKYIKY